MHNIQSINSLIECVVKQTILWGGGGGGGFREKILK